MKYHDNSNNAQRAYDPDGSLSDNWDPNGSYSPSEYVEVYFRMRTKGFSGMNGSFDTAACRDEFGVAARGVFEALGFSEEHRKMISSCSTVVRGYERLYLHPQNFSGLVRKSSVKEIAEALEDREAVFRCEWVDLYEDAVEATDDEYESLLKVSLPSMRRYALACAQTKRYDRYYPAHSIMSCVMKRYCLRRVNYLNGMGYVPDRVNSFDPVAAKVVGDMLSDLIHAGWMVAARDGGYIRSANKTEQRARHLKNSDLEAEKVSA